MAHLRSNVSALSSQTPACIRLSVPLECPLSVQQRRPRRCRCRRLGVAAHASEDTSSSGSSSSDSPSSSSAGFPTLRSQFLPLGGGDAIPLPPTRADMGPRFEFSREEALQVQLQALQVNDKPYFDHGIEVLYRFADFSPWTRATYFGRSLDLGQFERFRRVFHTPYYKPLLGHESNRVLSSLEVDERCWKVRLLVQAPHTEEQYTYEWTMVQRLGGQQDGFWRTHRLICDSTDWDHLRKAGI